MFSGLMSSVDRKNFSFLHMRYVILSYTEIKDYGIVCAKL